MSASTIAQRRLSIGPLEAIYIHEEADPSRTPPLREQIAAHGYLANPILVARPDAVTGAATIYPHLDGANRRTALEQLGCDKVVAQLVDLADPAQAQLASWAHQVRVRCIDRFLGTVAALPAARLSRLGAALALPRPGDAAYLHLADRAYRLRLEGPLEQRLCALRGLVAAYRSPITRHKLTPLPSPATLRALLAGTTELGTPLVVTFVPFTPAEFQELAAARLVAPAGVTRFVIPVGRIMGLNVPLNLLQPATSLVEAQDWIDRRLRRSRPRVIAPPSRVLEYCGPRDYDEPLICYDPALEAQPAPAAA